MPSIIFTQYMDIYIVYNIPLVGTCVVDTFCVSDLLYCVSIRIKQGHYLLCRGKDI